MTRRTFGGRDRFRAVTVEVPAAANRDPRAGHLLADKESSATAVVLIGFPSDEGVRRNGGRTGAAEGPAAIRRALARLTPDARRADAHTAILGATADLGDIAVTGDLETDTAILGDAVARQIGLERRVVVLGGGHEAAYGHALGHFHNGLVTRILNWDAHPDVRPLKETPEGPRGHSGSPFRQALEHPSGLCERYVVAGLQPASVAADHIDWMGTRGRAVWRSEVNDTTPALLMKEERPTLVSFDLDAVDGSQAPGVSAPSTNGLTSSTWLNAADEAARDPGVRSIDIVELCPPHDHDRRTARLAAQTVWRYLSALSE